MEKIEENELIKNRIYFFLNEKNLTINRLAQLSNLRQSTLNNIINRPTIPSISTIRMLCEGLGVSVVEFFDFEPYNQINTTEQENDKTIELTDKIDNMSQEIDNLKKIIEDLKKH